MWDAARRWDGGVMRSERDCGVRSGRPHDKRDISREIYDRVASMRDVFGRACHVEIA